MKDEDMIFQRGKPRELKVTVLSSDGQETVVINKNGPGFYTDSTPSEVAAALKPYF